MSDLNILLWALGGGFSILFALILLVWKTLREDMRSLREDVKDIDRRLCRLEGAFASKDCCMIKDHRIHEKVE